MLKKDLLLAVKLQPCWGLEDFALQALIVLMWILDRGLPIGKLQTLIFSLVVFSEMFNAFSWRSERYSVFSLGLFTNRPLVYAVLTTVILQLIVIYVPIFQTAFRTVPLSLFEWVVVLALASTTLISTEIVKYFYRRNLEPIRKVF